jgi:ethanolamine ammonia-lyase small subunit
MTLDPWHRLSALTPARIALGRAGASALTSTRLRFRADHARARDAVHASLDVDLLAGQLSAVGYEHVITRTMANSRQEYVLRPDLGRTLAVDSVDRLRTASGGPFDLAVVLCDGLSAAAIMGTGVELAGVIASTLDEWALAPIVVVERGRVAVGDEIGAILGARLVVVLIGERPGLSVPASLGAYITYAPTPGRTDAERNCVSNVHERGLSVTDAAGTVVRLLRRARAQAISGVELRDDPAAIE